MQAENFSFILAKEVSNIDNIEADGVFGLGLNKNGSCLLLDNLANNKLIDKKLFAFYFTSYIFASRIGGGYNF